MCGVGCEKLSLMYEGCKIVEETSYITIDEYEYLLYDPHERRSKDTVFVLLNKDEQYYPAPPSVPPAINIIQPFSPLAESAGVEDEISNKSCMFLCFVITSQD